MLANDLINRLERLGWLDQEIVEALRDQLVQSGTRVTPEAIAKLLVDNGQLTKFQATKLIGELRSGQYDDATEIKASGDTDDLVPVEELTTIDDETAVIEADQVAEVVYADTVEAEPIEVVSVDNGMAGAPGFDPSNRPVPKGKRPEKKANVWDSFKIYGYLGIIVFMLVGTVVLYLLLSRESADEYIKRADDMYSASNHLEAEKAYGDFLGAYGENNQYSSAARTKIMMCQLYQAEQFSDPTTGLDKAKELLPKMVEEDALENERGDLSELLVNVAENIAAYAMKAKETAEKERLLGRLDEQLGLMDNADYMSSSARVALSGKLQAIAEARARVSRDINRNNRLDESVAGMEKGLEAKDTKQAYDIRTQLLREFPELHDNERLVTLIEKASGIQNTLVAPSKERLEVSTATTAGETLDTIVLTTRIGDKIPGFDQDRFYLRAGGSVLAFACDDGRLLWRRFVGFGPSYAPVTIAGGEGVILSDAQSFEVQRYDGNTGSIVWRSQIGEPFAQPTIAGTTVFVAMQNGRLYALDADSGDTQWAVQIPQPVPVSPGVDSRTTVAYLPGDHSNLYAVNGRTGAPLESFYLGHEKGTIAVPPVALLGNVFVFENSGTDFVRIHVLKTNDSGTDLQVAQNPFRMTGNVTVPPLIQDRRVIVCTDRGEVAVYDIEQTAEREKVTSVASLVASADKPTQTQMGVFRSQLFITGSQVGRYELQINTGRIVPDWNRYPGDTFVGQPLVFEEALIHSRILRGTSGIRVMATDPKTGNELWQTDVGMPISMITRVPNEPKFHLVTTQGALFELDGAAIKSKSTQGPIENPGAKLVAVRFENPLLIDETKRVLVDAETSGQMLVYDPARPREKLRLITLGVAGNRVSGKSIVAGGGILLPMETGRLMLMNLATGAMLGSPYQPAADPGSKVTWSQPQRMPDESDQVIYGDSRKGLYRVRAGEQVRELAKVELPEPILGSTARVGDQLITAASGPAADFLVTRSISTLEETSRALMDGRIIWGPATVGKYALLLIDNGQMRAIDEQGKQLFSFAIPSGTPVGDPVVVGNSVILCGGAGWILNVDSSSGKIIGKVELGQPLSGTPVAVGNRLLVPGSEGVVYLPVIPTGQ